MTLLAHWKFDEGAAVTGITSAIDSVAGGSGSHSGTYGFTTGSLGRLVPGGVGGRHLRCISGTGGGVITSIGNPSDFRIASLFTAMFWFGFDATTQLYSGSTRKIFNCTGINDVDAVQNDWFDIRLFAPYAIQVRWETAPGVRVTVTSANYILHRNGWMHIAVVRYEVTPGFVGVRFYINGVLVDTQDNGGAGFSVPVGGSSALPYIGRDGYANDTGIIHIDSLRFYDTVENVATILGIYNDEIDYIEGIPVEEPDIYSSQSVINYGPRYSIIDSGENNPRDNAGFNQL
jgi:hypothetical protein